MPKMLLLQDYHNIGKEKNLRLDSAPATSYDDPVNWTCTLCGKEHTKSHRAVRVAKYGCSCQHSRTLKTNIYAELAEALGIVWAGWRQPKNTKEKTYWMSADRRNTVEASYAQLAFMPISKRLKLALNLSE